MGFRWDWVFLLTQTLSDHLYLTPNALESLLWTFRVCFLAVLDCFHQLAGISDIFCHNAYHSLSIKRQVMMILVYSHLPYYSNHDSLSTWDSHSVLDKQMQFSESHRLSCHTQWTRIGWDETRTHLTEPDPFWTSLLFCPPTFLCFLFVIQIVLFITCFGAFREHSHDIWKL